MRQHRVSTRVGDRAATFRAVILSGLGCSSWLQALVRGERTWWVNDAGVRKHIGGGYIEDPVNVSCILDHSIRQASCLGWCLPRQISGTCG